MIETNDTLKDTDKCTTINNFNNKALETNLRLGSMDVTFSRLAYGIIEHPQTFWVRA